MILLNSHFDFVFIFARRAYCNLLLLLFLLFLFHLCCFVWYNKRTSWTFSNCDIVRWPKRILWNPWSSTKSVNWLHTLSLSPRPGHLLCCRLEHNFLLFIFTISIIISIKIHSISAESIHCDVSRLKQYTRRIDAPFFFFIVQ